MSLSKIPCATSLPLVAADNCWDLPSLAYTGPFLYCAPKLDENCERPNNPCCTTSQLSSKTTSSQAAPLRSSIGLHPSTSKPLKATWEKISSSLSSSLTLAAATLPDNSAAAFSTCLSETLFPTSLTSRALPRRSCRTCTLKSVADLEVLVANCCVVLTCSPHSLFAASSASSPKSSASSSL